MKWCLRLCTNNLIFALALFSAIGAPSAVGEDNSNLETESGFFQEEDESAVAAEEAGDEDLKQSSEEEEEKTEGSEEEPAVAGEEGEAEASNVADEEEEPPVDEPMDVEDLDEPIYASPPDDKADEPTSRVYSEQRVRPVENLPHREHRNQR